MKTQIIALVASLLLASSVFAAVADAPAVTEEQNSKPQAPVTSEEKTDEVKTEEENK